MHSNDAVGRYDARHDSKGIDSRQYGAGAEKRSDLGFADGDMTHPATVAGIEIDRLAIGILAVTIVTVANGSPAWLFLPVCRLEALWAAAVEVLGR